MENRYEEDHITYEYRSDFDILIITADKAAEHNGEHDNALKQALERFSERWDEKYPPSAQAGAPTGHA